MGAKRARIVGGADVSNPGDWPWQASLQFSSGSHTCGAILISSNWVLCAAHCVSRSPSSYRIGLGLHDRTTQRQGQPAYYRTNLITRHPDYVQSGSRGFPNDVSVIRLTTTVAMNQFVAAASLAPSNAGDFVGNECYITGWGRLRGNGPLPNVLQEANVDVYSESECRGFWGSRITNIHICLGDRQTQRRGACNGDSGGPLNCRVGSGYPGWSDLLGKIRLLHSVSFCLRSCLHIQKLDPATNRSLNDT